MSNSYNELKETLNLENTQRGAIYLNCVFSTLTFIVLIVIAATLTPIAQDAGILIKDAGVTLKDISSMIPELNILMPEAQNTTRILGNMIPEISRGMDILDQLCLQFPSCQ